VKIKQKSVKISANPAALGKKGKKSRIFADVI
jgi:hypothetical protein